MLGVISALQAGTDRVGLIGKTFPRHGVVLPCPAGRVMLAMALLAIASMTLGLLISSLVNTSEKSDAAAVRVVMVQVVITGGVFPMGQGRDRADRLVLAVAVGLRRAASTTNLNVITPAKPGQAGPALEPHRHAWLTDIGLMLALGLFYSVITWWRLNKLEPAQAAGA